LSQSIIVLGGLFLGHQGKSFLVFMVDCCKSFVSSVLSFVAKISFWRQPFCAKKRQVHFLPVSALTATWSHFCFTSVFTPRKLERKTQQSLFYGRFDSVASLSRIDVSGGLGIESGIWTGSNLPATDWPGTITRERNYWNGKRNGRNTTNTWQSVVAILYVAISDCRLYRIRYWIWNELSPNNFGCRHWCFVTGWKRLHGKAVNGRTRKRQHG